MSRGAAPNTTATSESVTTAEPARGPFRGIRALGPGIITGAADDDPAGIATYSIAGAHSAPIVRLTVALTIVLMLAAATAMFVLPGTH